MGRPLPRCLIGAQDVWFGGVVKFFGVRSGGIDSPLDMWLGRQVGMMDTERRL